MEKLKPNEVKKIFIVLFVAVILASAVLFLRALRSPMPAQKDEVVPKTELQPTQKPAEVSIETPPGAMMIRLHKNFPIDVTGGQSTSTVQLGDTIIAAILINPGFGESVSGADAIVRFDPTFLSVVEPINTDFDFDSYPRKTVDAVGGVVKITGFGLGCDPCSGILATVNFKGLKHGQTSITLDYLPGKTNLSTIAQKGTGKNLLGRVEGATIEIN